MDIIRNNGTNEDLTNFVVDFYKKAQEIYSYLSDDKSKLIFQDIMLRTTTGEPIYNLDSYVSDYLKECMSKFDEELNSIDKSKKIILYGAGQIGKFVLSKIEDKSNILFCDRYYDIKKTVNGIKVISPDELTLKYKGAKVVICSDYFKEEIEVFLVENNIHDIVTASFYETENQYFDEVIKFSENEVFLDVGGMDGGTSCIFAKHVNNKYKKIYVFEPDKQNIEKIKNNSEFQNLHNAEVLELGASNRKEMLRFISKPGEWSVISEVGNTTIECDAIDNILDNEWVTFIKMDIEGTELNALEGAKNTILKNKPKLAICIYHKPEDVIVILDYIKSLVPEYKLYLRHHTTIDFETVVYAVL